MSKYNVGANFERRVKKQLEGKGYYVVRSAGSRGNFDLLAFKAHRRTIGIQCKYSKYKYNDEDIRLKFDDIFKELRGVAKALGIRTILAIGAPYQKPIYYDGWNRDRCLLL
jgi:Holliday junction resolvase